MSDKEYQSVAHFSSQARNYDTERDDKIMFLSMPDLCAVSSWEVRPVQSHSNQKKLVYETASAWLNLVAVFASNMILGYHVMTFGVYYVKFTDAFDTTKAISGAVGALNGFTIAITTLFASAIISLYGCKPCALVGCLLGTAGLFLSAFAPRIQFLYITYGLLSGTGFAFISLANMTIIQMSFNKHRAVATSISVTGIPIGNLIAPLATTYLSETLGWRGALMIHSGIFLHILVFTMLLLESNYKHNREKISECIQGMVKSLVDFSVLKNKMFVCYITASIFIRFNTVSYLEQFISRAVFYGMDLRTASLIMTYFCICSFVSRISITILFKFIDINPLVLCTTLAVSQGLMSVCMTLTVSYTWILFCSIVFGLAQGGMIIQALLCVVKIAGVDNFARSRAISNMFSSIANLTATPLMGLIFDVTQNYNTPFYISGGAGFTGGLVVFVLFIVAALKEKPSDRSEVTKESKYFCATQYAGAHNGDGSGENRNVKIRTFTF